MHGTHDMSPMLWMFQAHWQNWTSKLDIWKLKVYKWSNTFQAKPGWAEENECPCSATKSIIAFFASARCWRSTTLIAHWERRELCKTGQLPGVPLSIVYYTSQKHAAIARSTRSTATAKSGTSRFDDAAPHDQDTTDATCRQRTKAV